MDQNQTDVTEAENCMKKILVRLEHKKKDLEAMLSNNQQSAGGGPPQMAPPPPPPFPASAAPPLSGAPGTLAYPPMPAPTATYSQPPPQVYSQPLPASSNNSQPSTAWQEENDLGQSVKSLENLLVNEYHTKEKRALEMQIENLKRQNRALKEQNAGLVRENEELRLHGTAQSSHSLVEMEGRVLRYKGLAKQEKLVRKQLEKRLHEKEQELMMVNKRAELEHLKYQRSQDQYDTLRKAANGLSRSASAFSMVPGIDQPFNDNAGPEIYNLTSHLQNLIEANSDLTKQVAFMSGMNQNQLSGAQQPQPSPYPNYQPENNPNQNNVPSCDHSVGSAQTAKYEETQISLRNDIKNLKQMIEKQEEIERLLAGENQRLTTIISEQKALIERWKPIAREAGVEIDKELEALAELRLSRMPLPDVYKKYQVRDPKNTPAHISLFGPLPGSTLNLKAPSEASTELAGTTSQGQSSDRGSVASSSYNYPYYSASDKLLTATDDYSHSDAPQQRRRSSKAEHQAASDSMTYTQPQTGTYSDYSRSLTGTNTDSRPKSGIIAESRAGTHTNSGTYTVPESQTYTETEGHTNSGTYTVPDSQIYTGTYTGSEAATTMRSGTGPPHTYSRTETGTYTWTDTNQEGDTLSGAGTYDSHLRGSRTLPGTGSFTNSDPHSGTGYTDTGGSASQTRSGTGYTATGGTQTEHSSEQRSRRRRRHREHRDRERRRPAERRSPASPGTEGGVRGSLSEQLQSAVASLPDLTQGLSRSSRTGGSTEPSAYIDYDTATRSSRTETDNWTGTGSQSSAGPPSQSTRQTNGGGRRRERASGSSSRYSESVHEYDESLDTFDSRPTDLRSQTTERTRRSDSRQPVSVSTNRQTRRSTVGENHRRRRSHRRSQPTEYSDSHRQTLSPTETSRTRSLTEGGYTDYTGGPTGTEGGYTDYTGGRTGTDGGYTDYTGGWTGSEGTGWYTDRTGRRTQTEGGYSDYTGRQSTEQQTPTEGGYTDYGGSRTRSTGMSDPRHSVSTLQTVPQPLSRPNSISQGTEAVTPAALESTQIADHGSRPHDVSRAPSSSSTGFASPRGYLSARHASVQDSPLSNVSTITGTGEPHGSYAHQDPNQSLDSFVSGSDSSPIQPHRSNVDNSLSFTYSGSSRAEGTEVSRSSRNYGPPKGRKPSFSSHSNSDNYSSSSHGSRFSSSRQY